MFNMYPMGMMQSNMYGMDPMYSPNGTIPVINEHQKLKARYGVGYEDFGTRPFVQPCPISTVPRRPEPPIQENALVRFWKKMF